MIHDTIVPDFKEIRGRGRILVPLLNYVGREIPKTVNIVMYKGYKCIEIIIKKSVPIVPLSITFIWGISRKHLVRKAREGQYNLYDFKGNILPRDDKTSVTKFANYYELTGSL